LRAQRDERSRSSYPSPFFSGEGRPQRSGGRGGGDLSRYCEPTGRANARPMTGSAMQSMARHRKIEDGLLRRFASRNDDADSCAPSSSLRALAKQSTARLRKIEDGLLRRFAPRNDDADSCAPSSSLRALAKQSMARHRQIEDGLLRFARNDGKIRGGDPTHATSLIR